MLKKLFVASLLFCSFSVCAVGDFFVKGIRFEGLKRVSISSAFFPCSIRIGDIVSLNDIKKTIRSLYSSGNFKDVKILRDNDILIIKLKERPKISEVEIGKNKFRKLDFFKDKLKEFKLNVGDILNDNALSSFKRELKSVYFSIGQIDSDVKVDIINLPDNCVKLKFSFEESRPVKVQQINIFGNKSFSTSYLTSKFTSVDELPWWNVFRDQTFNQKKLLDDLESLRDFYFREGYVRFRINSTKIDISPNKNSVYITIDLTEGEKYKTDGVQLIGDAVGHSVEIERLAKISLGEIYNLSVISKIEKKIKEVLDKYGYAYSKVFVYPEINDVDKVVKLSVNIDPGVKFYVRKVIFDGNYLSKDSVLRREIRQMEGSCLVFNLIEKGRVHLNRTGYFEKVNFEINPVAFSSDQVDVIYKIQEKKSGLFNAGIGYSNGTGLTGQVSVNQNNWLGTGNDFGVKGIRNKYQTDVMMSAFDPYVTYSGIGLGGDLFFNKIRPGVEVNSEYENQKYGFNGRIDFFVTENGRFGVGIGFSHNEILNVKAQLGILRYFESVNRLEVFDDKSKYNFNDFVLSSAWIYNTLDNPNFPNVGNRTELSGKITLPIWNDSFYKIILKSKQYIPLDFNQHWILLEKLQIGYGDGVGNTEMPFYENFYMGGSQTLRGFQFNTVGPKSVYFSMRPYSMQSPVCRSNDPIGGSAMLLSNFELITPTPFVSERNADFFRTSLFVDVGGVWDTNWENTFETISASIPDYGDFSNIRVSAGVSLEIYTPFGPLNFCFAKALVKKKFDQLEEFQFSFGKVW